MKEVNELKKQFKKQQKALDSLLMQVEFNQEDIESLRDKIRPSQKMTKHEKLSLVIGAIVNLFICVASLKYLFFQ